MQICSEKKVVRRLDTLRTKGTRPLHFVLPGREELELVRGALHEVGPELPHSGVVESERALRLLPANGSLQRQCDGWVNPTST